MPSRNDVYLSPHSDDICFSLAALVSRRRRGRLVTIFSKSNYHVFQGEHIDDVTQTRKSEDKLFANACGLQSVHLDHQDAPIRGMAPFDLTNALQTSTLIEPSLLPYLLDQSAVSGEERAKLFVPCGIGGHVDHVAVTIFVARHFDALSTFYDICFYEDLHYASQAAVRLSGLRRFFNLFPGYKFQRLALELGELATRKLQLISLYRSQFTTLPTNLDEFVPAAPAKGDPLPPHEAFFIRLP